MACVRPYILVTQEWEIIMRDGQEEGRAALERLLEIAEGDSGGETRVRKFLLSWWNAPSFGGFDPTDLWTFDSGIVRDVFTVLVMINNARAYPDTLGYRDRFDWLVVRWHPDRISQEEQACPRYRDHFARLRAIRQEMGN